MAAVVCVAVLLLVVGLPRESPATLGGYVWALANRSFARGPMAPVWDAAVGWIRTHVEPGERVFVFGHDVGVQFLARIPPLSRVPTGVLDLRDDALNAHPFMVRLKQRLMTDLERDPPAWILVAAYDETWISKSGVESLPAFGPFGDFLRQRYVSVQSDLTSYEVFKRR